MRGCGEWPFWCVFLWLPLQKHWSFHKNLVLVVFWAPAMSWDSRPKSMSALSFYLPPSWKAVSVTLYILSGFLKDLLHPLQQGREYIWRQMSINRDWEEDELSKNWRNLTLLCGSAKYKKQEGQAFILGLCELSLFFSSHWKEVAANISNQVPDWISKPEYNQGLVGMGS